ncbi:MAG: 4Fe-4S binding protein [Pseudomonadota bacterium]
MVKRLILCDCSGSQQIDVAAIEGAADVRCSKIHTALCTKEIEKAAKAIAQGDTVIACQQERQRFEELAVEMELPVPQFVDLRDRAGWSDEGARAGPKMAALTAEALLEPPLTKTVDVHSDGTCLVIGEPEVSLPAAEQLSAFLSVTVLLPPGSAVPETRDYDVTAGRVRSVSGALGGFALVLDALQLVDPRGRGELTFTEPRDGARSQCDVVLDLSGGDPLVTAPDKREGYLRADPRHGPSVADAILEASHLIGTFEKPLYVDLTEELCAHSRAEQPACSRCLTVCPTGAITSAGDHVAVDPMICAGCGACSAVCPSGAISYADPTVDFVFSRLSTLASAFRKAGGPAPRLLVHDTAFGAQLIALSARHGRGLPGDFVPFETSALSGFGHAEMLTALAVGFASVDLLISPTTERDAMDQELELARALAGGRRLTLIEPRDPDELEAFLYDAGAAEELDNPVLPLGGRRQITRLAAQVLNPDPDGPLSLPAGAPYGAVLVDTDACTLCLSCASLCPSGALGDNPDTPQLRFQEDACLQCSLCASVCPEDAITLKPQMDLSKAALSQKVVHEEEPYPCIECGKLFGVKSTIERIVDQLAGKHPMFASSDAGRMIRMCDDCRVNAQFHAENQPFAQGERPKVRTTDDYYSKRRDH